MCYNSTLISDNNAALQHAADELITHKNQIIFSDYCYYEAQAACALFLGYCQY